MRFRSTIFSFAVCTIALSGISKGETIDTSAPASAISPAAAGTPSASAVNAERPAAVDASAAPATAATSSTAEATPIVAPDVPQSPAPESAETVAETAQKKKGIGKLVAKLTGKDGKQIKIGVLKPLDYTTLDFADIAAKVAIESIKRYGDFDITLIDDAIPALTLEEFRHVVIRHNMDIIMVIVLKPTNFDLFLFDRRTPYNVYAHSETLPEEIQYQLTQPIVEEYTKTVVRRILYAYLQDQYFELPREEPTPFMEAEIPRWIASARSFGTINRELLSHFYGSISVGAALAMGGKEGAWNSNLVGLQVGAKVYDQFYLELAASLFSYNAFLVGGKYIFINKDSPFRFSLGLNGASVSNKHTLNYDQRYTQGLGSSYIVPSAALIFPIVDIHFKIESQMYVGLGGGKFIFTVMPGLFILF